MPLKTGKDPAQFGLFATPIEAMIAEDNEVRDIVGFVDLLDLPALGFKMTGHTGASAYGLKVLLKIYPVQTKAVNCGAPLRHDQALLGLHHTSLKGKEKANGEWSLIHLCYNLRRSVSILGVKGLIRALQAENGSFLGCFVAEMPGGAGGHEPVSRYLEAAEAGMDENRTIFKDCGLNFRTGCRCGQVKKESAKNRYEYQGTIR